MTQLAPCRCGHPGLGCSCYEERRAEAEAADRPVTSPARGGPDTDEWWAQLFLATHDAVDGVPYAAGSEYPTPHIAAFRAAAEPLILPVVQLLAAEELRAAAKAWQWGAWADTPRHADRIADRIGAAQYVTDWLLARAAGLASPAPAPRAEEGQW